MGSEGLVLLRLDRAIKRQRELNDFVEQLESLLEESLILLRDSNAVTNTIDIINHKHTTELFLNKIEQMKKEK